MKILKHTHSSLHLRSSQFINVIFLLGMSLAGLGLATIFLTSNTRTELICQERNMQKTCQITSWRWLETVSDRQSFQLKEVHTKQKPRKNGYDAVLILQTDRGNIEFDEFSYDNASAIQAKKQLNTFVKDDLKPLDVKIKKPSSMFMVLGLIFVGTWILILSGLMAARIPYLIEWKFEKMGSSGTAQIYLRGLWWKNQISVPFEEIIALDSIKEKDSYTIKLTLRDDLDSNRNISPYMTSLFGLGDDDSIALYATLSLSEWQEITAAISKILGIKQPEKPLRGLEKLLKIN